MIFGWTVSLRRTVRKDMVQSRLVLSLSLQSYCLLVTLGIERRRANSSWPLTCQPFNRALLCPSSSSCRSRPLPASRPSCRRSRSWRSGLRWRLRYEGLCRVWPRCRGGAGGGTSGNRSSRRGWWRWGRIPSDTSASTSGTGSRSTATGPCGRWWRGTGPAGENTA